ncbi:MAG: glucokinase [Beijerinckiaceae bacterium]
MNFPHPLLVCDIGGTNVRIGAVARPGDSVRRLGNAPTASHSSFLATIKVVEERAKVRPRSLLISAAGPIDGARVRLTNADWTIDGPELADALDLESGLLFNDFEAQAIALPHLGPDWTRQIGATRAEPFGPQLVLGPGTGLGAAALLRAGGGWLPVTTEAGHMDLGPTDSLEDAIWTHLPRVEGRVTFESVLSGPGLARLYAALRASRGLHPLARDPAEVTAAAEGGESLAVETIGLFWKFAARCAGDLALAFLPRGGVTLGGGVLPRLARWLDAESFRRVFEAKAPMDMLMRAIPTRLLVETDSALAGMAALAARPDDYVIDYEARAWRR